MIELIFKFVVLCVIFFFTITNSKHSLIKINSMQKLKCQRKIVANLTTKNFITLLNKKNYIRIIFIRQKSYIIKINDQKDYNAQPINYYHCHCPHSRHDYMLVLWVFSSLLQPKCCLVEWVLLEERSAWVTHIAFN
jgi:hypothetical protein